MKSIATTTSVWLLLAAVSILPRTTRADLNYYLYLEEDEATTGAESSVMVLRSVGFLPLHESTPLPPPADLDRRQRRGCPEMVATDGGINPNFLCVGPELRSQIAYPIAESFRNPSKLPIRFSAFARSRGTPSGILAWKDALVVSSTDASDYDLLLESVSMGPDTSKDAFNTNWLLSSSSSSSGDSDNNNNNDKEDTLLTYQTNEVIAEWYLLTEEGGDPIRDGGLIRFLKGKPPSTVAEDLEDAAWNENENESEEEATQAGDDTVLATTTTTTTDEAAEAAAVSLTSRPTEAPRQPDDAATKPSAAVSLTSRPTEAPKKSDDHETDTHHSENNCRTITSVICSNEHNSEFGTLCSLMMQVGLDTVFDMTDGSYFTVFAPTNEAFRTTFADLPSTFPDNPALLSGHDLTKLLLTHVVVTGIGTDTGQSQTIGGESIDEGIRYEDMVCGTKQEMASDQVAKFACDEFADVAYLVGPGNTGKRPVFLEVDMEACNGILHSLDAVVLPGSKTRQQQEHFHNTAGGVVDLAMPFEEPDVGTFPDASTTNNALEESAIASFFEATMRDFAKDDNDAGASLAATGESIINNYGSIGNSSSSSSSVGSSSSSIDGSGVAENAAAAYALAPQPPLSGTEEKETKPPASSSTGASTNENGNKNSAGGGGGGGIDTESAGFHSFFGRKGVAADLAAIHGSSAIPASSGFTGRTRPGNLRHRQRQ